MSDSFRVPLVVGTVRKLQYGRGVSVPMEPSGSLIAVRRRLIAAVRPEAMCLTAPDHNLQLCLRCRVRASNPSYGQRCVLIRCSRLRGPKGQLDRTYKTGNTERERVETARVQDPRPLDPPGLNFDFGSRQISAYPDAG
jgi:hypothetical protein